MKSSKYTFFLASNDIFYCFNAISCNFFKIDKSRLPIIKKILNCPEDFEKTLPTFITKLKMNNFIIDDETNEIEYIRNEQYKRIYEKKYKLIIMPTLGCNFKCWYCVQDHKTIRMSPETVNMIKRNIRYNIEQEKIRELTLDWFGGEPFLCFNEVIEPLSNYAIEICNKNKVTFNNTTTTNGYLLNEDIIKKLNQYHFRFFQITLDGDRNHHNQTRVSKKDSSFDRIINNINLLTNYIENIQVSLRINYDKNSCSKELIDQLDCLIPFSNRNKIKILFRKVWQATIDSETKNLLETIRSNLKDIGFGVETLSYPSYIPCYVSKKYQITVSPNGGIYKCTAMSDYTSNSYGRFGEDGRVIWRTPDFYENYLSYSSIENEYCLTCKYLPLCMGSCHQPFENAEFNAPKFFCKKKSKVDYEKDILTYCQSLDNIEP